MSTASLNKCILIGRLGRDAELRYTKAGDAVATLSVATTEVWNDKATGEKVEKAEWHRVVLWGKVADALAAYLTKGKHVYVEGRLRTHKWTKEGVDRYTTEIRSDRIMLLGAKDAAPTAAPVPEGGDHDDPQNSDTDDQIPF